MKQAFGNLIGLGIFAALLATLLVPWFVAEHHFRLHEPWPILIGAGSLSLTLLGLYRWLLHLQRKERAVLATSHHPIFGKVHQLRNHWEASLSLHPDGPTVEVSGEALEPLPGQVSTFAAIRDRYPELLTRTIEAAREFFGSLRISVSSEDLELDSIYLSNEGIGSFELTFSVPAHEQKLPWGLSATFHEFSVDEISDNH